MYHRVAVRARTSPSSRTATNGDERRERPDASYLEPVVAAVVHDEHQRSYAHEVNDVGKREQTDRGDVMNEHLPEVLSFHVDELRKDQ